MKQKMNVFLLVLFLGNVVSLSAKTLRVNADIEPDPAKGIYSSLETAHNAASDGDVLLVDGAVNAYEGFTCTKRLTIIGPGYDLLENNMPQRNPNEAILYGRMLFAKGSEGSVISGVRLNNTTSAIQVGTDDITVRQCKMYRITVFTGVTSALIAQNDIMDVSITNNVNVNGVIFKNNIVRGGFYFNSSNNYSIVFAHVEHNVFLGRVVVTADNFRNNIIVSNSADVNITSTNIRNNLSARLADGATNIAFDENSLFVGLTDANGSPDGQYRIKPDSPYRQAGSGGTEPGIFGGDMPYFISGLSGIPSIYGLQSEATTTLEKGLHVEVKAKTNP